MGAVVGLELVGVEFDGFVVLGLNVGILDEVCFAVGVAVGIDEVNYIKFLFYQGRNRSFRLGFYWKMFLGKFKSFEELLP